MITIGDCSCGKRCRAGSDKCASCETLERKANRIKPSDNNSSINKFSAKGAKVNTKYLNRLRTWKRGKKCAATFPHECSSEIECHHQGGRSNDSFWDEDAEQAGIVLTMDERLWLPVCPNAHRYITTNSKWACENGYSYLRVTDKVFQRKIKL